MLTYLFDDRSTLVHVMAWCRQVTGHNVSWCWTRSMSPYCVTGPRWVNRLCMTILQSFSAPLELGWECGITVIETALQPLNSEVVESISPVANMSKQVWVVSLLLVGVSAINYGNCVTLKIHWALRVRVGGGWVDEGPNSYNLEWINKSINKWHLTLGFSFTSLKYPECVSQCDLRVQNCLRPDF